MGLIREVDISRPVILACRTLELELQEAMRQTGCTYPVVWIASGLHNTPEKLKQALEDALLQCEGYSCILTAMGFCGNAFAGLRTKHAALLLPRVDDCISLLLGSMAKRTALNAQGIYYFTEGWLKGERTLLAEYQHALDKFGERRANAVFSVMLRNYRKAAFLDTGCGDCDWSRAHTKLAADTLHLEYCELPGTLDYLKRLLSGTWEERDFILIPPETEITESRFVLQKE